MHLIHDSCFAKRSRVRKKQVFRKKLCVKRKLLVEKIITNILASIQFSIYYYAALPSYFCLYMF